MKKVFPVLLLASLLTQTATAVEVGSFLVKLEGAFLTGDSNFDAKKGVSTPLVIKNTKLNGGRGSISFGYLASEELISDITFSYGSKKNKKDTTVTAVDTTTPRFNMIEDQNFRTLINASYLFNAGSKLTPYVTMGIGAGITKSKMEIPSGGIVVGGSAIKNNATTAVNVTGSVTSKNTTYFAYQGGLGLKFYMTPNLAFDMGYKASNHQGGSLQNLETTASVKGKNVIEHGLALGLEMAF